MHVKLLMEAKILLRGSWVDVHNTGSTKRWVSAVVIPLLTSLKTTHEPQKVVLGGATTKPQRYRRIMLAIVIMLDFQHTVVPSTPPPHFG